MSKKNESKVTKTKAVAVVAKPVQTPSSVDSMITLAIEKGASVETMERLFALHERVQASHARSVFTRSMSELQSELPVIKKLKAGVNAKFAPLEDIVESTKATIQKHGFTYRWNTKQTESQIVVTCIATHIDGHSEEVEMTSEVEEVVTGKQSGAATKSAPQRAASTITFLKRYTLMNMFGIVVAGEDFDGRMEQQKKGRTAPPPPKNPAKTTVKEMEQRAEKKIAESNDVSEVIKVDEYVQGDKTFSAEFKKKIHTQASARVTAIENGK